MGPEAPQYEEGSVSSSVTNEDGTPYIPEMSTPEGDTSSDIVGAGDGRGESEELGDEVTPEQLQGFLATDVQQSYNKGDINAEQFSILKKEINKEKFSSEDFTRLNRMLEGFEEDNWIQDQGPDFAG